VATGGGGYDLDRVVPRAWALLWSELSGRRLPSRTTSGWLGPRRGPRARAGAGAPGGGRTRRCRPGPGSLPPQRPPPGRRSCPSTSVACPARGSRPARPPAGRRAGTPRGRRPRPASP
jgi:hypothetical protein